MKFNLGQVVATPGALALGVDLTPYLDRHVSGDWCDLDTLDLDDQMANESALLNGERILSKYRVRDDAFIYIITEWDRSYTTALLPEEY